MKITMPEISIIIPFYNARATLTRCIESLKSQSFQDFEAIFVDDGSTDGACEIIKKLAPSDARFIYIKKENGGVSSARNLGIEKSRGNKITFLDADDILLPEALKEMNNALEIAQTKASRKTAHSLPLHCRRANYANIYSATATRRKNFQPLHSEHLGQKFLNQALLKTAVFAFPAMLKSART